MLLVATVLPRATPLPPDSDSRPNELLDSAADAVSALQPTDFRVHTPPKALPACADAVSNSRQQIDEIAAKLGVENKLTDTWESQLLYRQAQGLRASNGKELVYYIQPKSVHSTIHNHLLAAGPFEGAMDAWDAIHSASPNELLHQQGRSAAASEEFAQVMEGKQPPLEWTVAREPLGHFIAGFDQARAGTRPCPVPHGCRRLAAPHAPAHVP